MLASLLVDITFLILLGFFLFKGYQKGFLFSVLGLLSLLIALGIAYLTYPFLGTAIFNAFLNNSLPVVSRVRIDYLTANFFSFLVIFVPIFYFLRKGAISATQQLFAAFIYTLINHRSIDSLLGSILTGIVGGSLVCIAFLLLINFPLPFNKQFIYDSNLARKVLPLVYGFDSGVNTTLGRSSQSNVLSYLAPQNESFTDPSRVFSKLSPSASEQDLGPIVREYPDPSKMTQPTAQPTYTTTVPGYLPPQSQPTPDSSSEWNYSQKSNMTNSSAPPRNRSVMEILGYKELNLEEERRRLIDLVNQSRREAGQNEVVEDPVLTQLAQRTAEEIKRTGYVSHFDSRGKDNIDRAREAGLEFTLELENLSLAPNAEAAHKSEMASAGHRRTIVRKEMERIGAAVMPGVKGMTLYVKEFLTTDPNVDLGPQSD